MCRKSRTLRTGESVGVAASTDEDGYQQGEHGNDDDEQNQHDERSERSIAAEGPWPELDPYLPVRPAERLTCTSKESHGSPIVPGLCLGPERHERKSANRGD